jgi:hypothetical protein
MRRYSPERAEVARFELNLGQGRSLHCLVTEYWKDIDQTTASCGAKHEYKITRRVGISRTDKTALEASIKGSLGSEAFAKLESQLKGKFGRETTFEVSKEVEKSFSFEAPRCGTRTDWTYQLCRDHSLSYRDTRFWHRGRWDMTITEFVSRFHSETLIVPNPALCRCDEALPEFKEALNCDMGSVSMLCGAERVADTDYRVQMGGRVASMREDFGAEDIYVSDDMHFSEAKVRVPRWWVPGVLLFLSGDARELIQAHFTPYEFADVPKLEPVTNLDTMLVDEDRGEPLGAS